MIKPLIALLISVVAYAQCTLVLNPKTRNSKRNRDIGPCCYLTGY